MTPEKLHSLIAGVDLSSGTLQANAIQIQKLKFKLLNPYLGTCLAFRSQGGCLVWWGKYRAKRGLGFLFLLVIKYSEPWILTSLSRTPKEKVLGSLWCIWRPYCDISVSILITCLISSPVWQLLRAMRPFVSLTGLKWSQGGPGGLRFKGYVDLMIQIGWLLRGLWEMSLWILCIPGWATAKYNELKTWWGGEKQWIKSKR